VAQSGAEKQKAAPLYLKYIPFFSAASFEAKISSKMIEIEQKNDRN
jgi:hypothetical protein